MQTWMGLASLSPRPSISKLILVHAYGSSGRPGHSGAVENVDSLGPRVVVLTGGRFCPLPHQGTLGNAQALFSGCHWSRVRTVSGRQARDPANTLQYPGWPRQQSII